MACKEAYDVLFKSVNKGKNEIVFSFLLVGPGKSIVEDGRMTKSSSEQKKL